MFQWLSKSSVLRPLLKYLLIRRSEALQRYVPWIKQYRVEELARLDAEGMLAIMWLSAIDRYLMLRKTGVPIIALRYEDLVDRPREIIQQLLDWCHLTETRLIAVPRCIGNGGASRRYGYCFRMVSCYQAD